MAPEAENKVAVSSERQRLFQFLKFSLKQREDGLIVPDYNIQEESTLHMNLRLGRRMLSVKTMAQTTLMVAVEPSDTVLDVKLKIHDMEGIPVVEQRLLFLGRQLSDKEILADCGIQEGSTVYLVVWCYLRAGYVVGPEYLAYVDFLRMLRIT